MSWSIKFNVAFLKTNMALILASKKGVEKTLAWANEFCAWTQYLAVQNVGKLKQINSTLCLVTVLTTVVTPVETERLFLYDYRLESGSGPFSHLGPDC